MFTQFILCVEGVGLSKAANMAKVTASGSFHMLWGLVASTVILAVGSIIIASLLGESNYGLYTIALTAPGLIATFRDWGVNSAVVKYTAQYREEDKQSQIRGIFISGLVFETVLGLVLSLVCFFLSGFLATSVFQRPGLEPLIQVASFTILAGGLMNTATAAFTGVEQMKLNSVTLVIQAILRTGLIVFLVVLGLGSFGAISGYTVAFGTASLIGILLMWTIYRNLPKDGISQNNIGADIKKLFRYGLPLSISSILSGFMAQFYSMLMAIYVTSDALIGNYSVASNFVVLITFISTPVTTMLFPAFSKLDHRRDNETLKNVFQFSVKYAALLVVPLTMAIIALSEPGIAVLFGNRFSDAPLFLALLAFGYIMAAFGTLSIGSLINGQGDTGFNMKLTLLMVAIGFPLGFVLISQFGIVGLIVATVASSLSTLVVALPWIKKHYGVTIDWTSSLKILFCSALAAVLTYLVTSGLSWGAIQINLASLITLIVGAVVFLFVFIFSILLTRTVSRADIRNLKEMLSKTGVVAKVANLALGILEKIMTLLRL